jgi:hypothetical protein
MTRYARGYIARHGADPKHIGDKRESVHSAVAIKPDGRPEVKLVYKERGNSSELRYYGNEDMELVSERTETNPTRGDGKPVTTTVIGDILEARRTRDRLETICLYENE